MRNLERPRFNSRPLGNKRRSQESNFDVDFDKIMTPYERDAL